MRREPPQLPSLSQRLKRRRAQPIRTYTVVVTEDKEGGAEAIAEDGAEVVGGGETREGAVEGQGLDPIDAEAAQQRLLFLRRIQQPEGAGVLLQDGARVLRERNDNRLLAPFAGGGDECLYHLTVAQMDPVEKAGGDYSHFTSGKSCRCASSGFFGYTRLATWYMPVCSGSTSVS